MKSGFGAAALGLAFAMTAAAAKDTGMPVIPDREWLNMIRQTTMGSPCKEDVNPRECFQNYAAEGLKRSFAEDRHELPVDRKKELDCYIEQASTVMGDFLDRARSMTPQKILAEKEPVRQAILSGLNHCSPKP